VRLAAALLLVALPAAPAAAAPVEPQRLYLNFSDGTETLTMAADDDAPTNLTSVLPAAPYPAFSWPSIVDGSATRAEVVKAITRGVHDLFLPYNVLVTTVRPPAGPYTMVMIGGNPMALGFEGRVAGLAFMDCDNRQPSNLVFAFPVALRGRLTGLEVTIAQEAAHALGLEHTVDPRDVMYPMVDPAQAGFLDQEVMISGTQQCGPSTQNSHRRLLEIVGPWPGDEKPLDDGTRADRSPPRLTLLEPAPGATVAQPFTVRVAAEDDEAVDHVVLAVGADRGIARRGPFAWSLAGFPAGPVTLTFTGYDRSGNVAMLSADVTLEAEAGGGCAVAGPGRRGWSGTAVFPVLALLAACARRRRRLYNRASRGRT
jgi:hypothetical protein